MNLRAFLDFLETVSFSKLGVGVIETVLVIFSSDFSEMLGFCAICFHVVESCIAKEHRSKGLRHIFGWD